MPKTTAYEILMNQRKEIVEKFIKNMEDGFLFTPGLWNREIFRPQNPVSNVQYQGANRLILSFMAIQKGYKDPRWLTYKQAQESNLKIKPEELKNSVICEKWIWSKEIEVDDEEHEGEKIKKIVTLDRPQVYYFRVYNGSQIENMPELEKTNINEEKKDEYVDGLIDNFITSSKCPVNEIAQEKSFYQPSEDKIVLPLRSGFTSDEAFLTVLWHEMAHSTGHKDRLNRELTGLFGSEKYAREELTAELTAVFLEAEYGVGETFEQNHTNYFKSWIKALKENPNELFFASNDASKVADYLIENYDKVVELKQEISRIDEQLEQVQNENEELKAELKEIEDEKLLPEVKELLEELKYPEELINKYQDFIYNIKDNLYLEDYKTAIRNLADIDSIDSNIKVFINWSENPNFKKADILSFEKMNSISEQEEIRISKDLGYDKVSFILFYPGKDGKMQTIHDRIDIGDGSQKNLKDFIKQCYKINLDEYLKETESEKEIHFRENPFSEELVKTLKSGTMFPEAITINEDYNSFLQESKKEYEELIKLAPEEKERIDKQYNLYVKNTYLNKLAYYKAQASIPNWTVTGRGNYNFSKLEKRNEREHKIYEKLKEVQNKWNNFKHSIKTQILKAEKREEAKSIAEKLALGEQNPVKFTKSRIGNIDCYRSENYIIVKHYSAFTVLSKKWEEVLSKQENIWQLNIPSSLDNRRFATLRDAKHLASYFENFSETAESNNSPETLKDKLYNKTQAMYKALINEEDINNPKTEEYKKANKAENNISTETTDEIIGQAKKDLKEEIGEEIASSNREPIIEEELTLEIQT